MKGNPNKFLEGSITWIGIMVGGSDHPQGCQWLLGYIPHQIYLESGGNNYQWTPKIFHKVPWYPIQLQIQEGFSNRHYWVKTPTEDSGLHHQGLYDIFIYIYKAHDSLNSEHTLNDVASYGLGGMKIQLLSQYWKSQMFAARVIGYYRLGFTFPVNSCISGIFSWFWGGNAKITET